MKEADDKLFNNEKLKVVELHHEQEQSTKQKKYFRSRFKLVSAKEIQAMEIPLLEWIVENLLCEGLTVLAGKPKAGKSFLCMDLGLSIAKGETALSFFPVMKSEVVYFALEDSRRRIQSRLNKILTKGNDRNAPDNFYFLEDNQSFLRLNDGGIDELKILLKDYPDVKLIIIDTLGRSRADRGRHDNIMFQGDYSFLAPIQELALKNKICIILVHHTKKSEEENIIDEISGTTGITAVADTILILKKVKGEHKLFVTGRDIPETEYRLMFDDATSTWNATGEGRESESLTAEREEILALLSQRNEPMKTGEIAQAVGKETSNVSKLLQKLVDEGLVINPRYGHYQFVAAEKQESLPSDDARESSQSG